MDKRLYEIISHTFVIFKIKYLFKFIILFLQVSKPDISEINAGSLYYVKSRLILKGNPYVPEKKKKKKG